MAAHPSALASAGRRVMLALYIVRSLPPALLMASGIGCSLFAAQMTGLVGSALCISQPSIVTSPDLFRAALALNPPATLALSWLAMLLAMMPPLLAQPLLHVWRRSLRRRQRRAVALFALGYTAIWCAAGVVLSSIALALGAASGAAMLLGAALVLGWAATPFAQLSLNRCHRRPCLAGTGIAADADVLQYGVSHGAWCIGACWPVMLLPLLAGPWHLPVMGAAALWLISERSRVPRPAQWGFGWRVSL